MGRMLRSIIRIGHVPTGLDSYLARLQRHGVAVAPTRDQARKEYLESLKRYW